MIIKCPYCGRRFELQRRPPETFCCPKCSYKVPFSVILQEQHSEKTMAAPASGAPVTAGGEPQGLPTSVINGQGDKTVVVEGLNGGLKTKLIP